MTQQTQTVSFRLPVHDNQKLEQAAHQAGAKSRHEYAKRIVLETLHGSQQLAALQGEVQNLIGEVTNQAHQIADLATATSTLGDQFEKTLTPLKQQLRKLHERSQAPDSASAKNASAQTARLLKDFRIDLATTFAALLVELTEMPPKDADRWVREHILRP